MTLFLICRPVIYTSQSLPLSPFCLTVMKTLYILWYSLCLYTCQSTYCCTFDDNISKLILRLHHVLCLVDSDQPPQSSTVNMIEDYLVTRKQSIYFPLPLISIIYRCPNTFLDHTDSLLLFKLHRPHLLHRPLLSSTVTFLPLRFDLTLPRNPT